MESISKELLAYASARYYAGDPIISDEAFDALAYQYNWAEVGHQVDLTKAIKHHSRLYSLEKYYEDAPNTDYMVETPKLDGSAVSLLYVKGKFVRGLTRGNGIEGLDISSKLALLVPSGIPQGGVIQITGEVVAPKHIANSRNYAAGALNLNDLEEFKTRELCFVAYDTTLEYETYLEKLSALSSMGFIVVKDYGLDEQFPTDGKVYRINDEARYQAMGFTSKHPRGAFAIKERKDGVVTTLLGVEWNVGRTGIVAPTAILEPVIIGDALVSRATLNNPAFIRAMELEIGCQVEVRRAGEIIPEIVRRV